MNEARIIKYGEREIPYTVIFRKRETLEISVLPDLSVEVVAPENASMPAIEQRVQRKASWIVEKQNWFAKFPKAPPPKQYLGGETHLYMGRRYRLKIEKAECCEIKIDGGFIRILTKDLHPASVKKILDEWLRAKATVLFKKIFADCVKKYAKSNAPHLQIRNMKTRWGSLSKNGILTLNTKLIAVPKECIEYVVVHELCHLKHTNHDNRFYQLLETRMPDWQRRKQKLENMQI